MSASDVQAAQIARMDEEIRLNRQVWTINEASWVASHIVRAGKDAWDESSVHRFAGEMVVVKLGELAKSLPHELRVGIPEVNWRAAGKIRDLIVHQPDDVDHDLVWRTQGHDVPELAQAVNRWIDQQMELGSFEVAPLGRKAFDIELGR